MKPLGRKQQQRAPIGEVGKAEKVERHKLFDRPAPKNVRNKPCFCGSGKKFKKCHGAVTDKELTGDIS